MFQTEAVDLKITRFFEALARLLLSLLIVAIFIALVLSLAGVRIVAVRFSPLKVREEL